MSEQTNSDLAGDVARLRRQVDDLTAVVTEHQSHFESLWNDGFLGDLDGPVCDQPLGVAHDHDRDPPR
ncbi:hypothetical protein [Longispora urticae]